MGGEVNMDDLIAFIGARLDEDECGVHYKPERALREVATWRAILAAVPPADRAEFRSGFNAALGLALQAKAREYSGHPDWRMDGRWGS